MTFQIRILCPSVITENQGQHPSPPPSGHIDNRIGALDHVSLVRKASFQDAIVTLDLIHVSLCRVGDLFGCKVLEMHRLTGKGSHAGSDEHEPREQLTARSRRWQNFPVFSAR